MKRSPHTGPFVVGASIVAMLSLWAIGSQVIQPTGIPQDATVAERNGKQITYGEICLKPESLEPLAQYGWDRVRIRDYQKRSEFDNLKRILEDSIVSKTVEKLGVKPSREAIDTRAAEITLKYYGKRTFTEEDAQQQNEVMQSMVRLIETWQTDHEAGETLYNREFARRITPHNWEKLKKEYSTPEALEALRRRQPTVNAKAMNDWIRQKATQQIAKEDLVKKLRVLGEIRPDEDYLDWLYRQLVTVRILRGDVIPYASRPGGAEPEQVPIDVPPREAQKHPEFNTAPVPSRPTGK